MTQQPRKKNRIWLYIAVLLVCAVLFELGFSALTRDDLPYEQRAVPGTNAVTFELTLEKTDANGDWYTTLARDSYIELGDIGGVPVQTVFIAMTRQQSDQTQGIIRFQGVVDGVAGEYMIGIVPDGDGYRAQLDAQSVEWMRIFPTETLHTLFCFSGVTLNDRVDTGGPDLARCILWAFVLAAFFLTGNKLAALLFKKTMLVRGWLSGYFLFGALIVGAAYLATTIYSGMRGLGSWVLLAAAVLFTGIYVLIWVFVVKVQKPETKLAVAVLTAGLLFSVASAPLQVPDEPSHFLRAYSISRLHLDYNYKENYPDDVYNLLATFPGYYYENIQKPKLSSVPADIADYMAHADETYVGIKEATKIQVTLPYIPAALFIAVCRLLGGNALICLYAGRFANVIALAACAWFAMKNAVRYRGALVAMTLLPMTLYMTASLSYDALFLCGAVLYFGLLLRAEIRRRDMILLCVVLAFMLSIKPVYAPLALLLFLVPKEAFKPRFKRGVGVLILLGCGAALYALTLLYAAWFGTSIPPNEHLIGVDVLPQIQYVLRNPLRYLLVMAVDGYGQMFYLGQFGFFGWMDVHAVFTGLFTPAVLISIGVLYADEQRGRKKNLLWLMAGLIVVLYAIVVTGFYASWSTLGSTTILGVQVRYLIPLVPLLVVLISSAFSPVIRFRDSVSDRALMRDRICVHLAAAFATLSALELAMLYFLM